MWSLKPARQKAFRKRQTSGDFTVKPNFVRNEWLVFYPDSAPGKFDYRVKCQSVALYVGSESSSSTERTESKQVEDGYDEIGYRRACHFPDGPV